MSVDSAVMALSRPAASSVRALLVALATLAVLSAVASAGAAAQTALSKHGTRSCNRAEMSTSRTVYANGVLAAGDVAQVMKPADYSCIGWALGRATSLATVSWESPADRARFSVTPTRTYDSMEGERCRDYVVRAVVDNRTRENAQSACKASNGSWHLYVAGGGN